MQTSDASGGAQANVAGANNNNSGMPLPPKDARYTLFCESIPGPDHVHQANYLKSQLLKGTTLKDWYVVHSEQESTLYYGYYRTYNDPKDAKETDRAQLDLKQIHAIKTTGGDEPFRLAIFVELASPDPSAPAEWNLANLKINDKDTEHYWSLEIAAYHDSPQRKQAAVDTVKAARAQGVEAYYYHGESVSSVLVGCWPKSAVKEQDSDAGESTDPSTPLMIIPWTLPAGTPTDVRTPEGDRIKIMAPKVEPLDPSLQAAMRQYPDHPVNGSVMVRKIRNPKTGVEKEVSDRSFIIEIPVRGSAVSPAGMPSGGTIVDATGQPVARPAASPPPSIIARPAVTPGGKLKGIGD
jgi:hypothetical protein